MMAKRGKYNRRRRSGDFSFLYKLLTFALICGAIAVALALFFKVEDIEVVGSARYSAEQVVEASEIHTGDNLFLMNKYRAAENITSALPYIQTVQISRRIPTTLCIDITECTALAAVNQEGQSWLLSGEGKIVDSVSAVSSSKYTQVTGITLSAPVIGQFFTAAEEFDTASVQLLDILKQLEQKSMLADVQEIHLEDSSTITLRYLDRFDVLFPWNADFDYKLDYLLAVVERLEVNETGTIDMTQADKACFIPA